MSVTTGVDLSDPEAPASRWTLVDHVKERAEERGFHVADILEAAEYPEIIAPDKKFPWREHRQRGEVRVVVNPLENCVITVVDAFHVRGTERGCEARMAVRAAETAVAAEAAALAAKTELAMLTAVEEAKLRERQRKAISPLLAKLAPRTRLTAVPALPEMRPVAAPAAAEPAAPVRVAPHRPLLLTPRMAALQRELRTKVLPQLRKRPGQWAFVDTNRPGVATLLAKEENIEIDVVDGHFKARWAA